MELSEINSFFQNHPLREEYFSFSEAERSGCAAVAERDVTAAADEVRGQVVKACVVLVPGTEKTDALKKEIQEYVKTHTAPYKYPRNVEFRDSLPKTISGKIQRSLLREGV